MNRRIIPLLIAALLLLGGCSRESASSPASSSSSAGTKTTSSSSKSPEEASSPPQSSRPESSSEESSVPEASQAESYASLSEGTVQAQEQELFSPVEAGDSDFAALFQENPVDALLSELWEGSSNADKTTALQEISAVWRGNIDSFYQQLLTLDEGNREALQQEQGEWSLGLTQALSHMEEQARAAGSPGVESGRLTMNHYRSRAAELAHEIYKITGELPAFSTEPEAPVG